MGKASSSKKVARVARTGGGRTTRRSRASWGFPTVMGLVVVLGVLGVWLSRDAAHHSAAADSPTVNDHWHAAYGFDICGNFLPDLPQPPNLIGLHTHGDGVIHIEPQDPVLDTGSHATLGRFVSGYPGLEMTPTSLTVLNETWKNGDPKCNGQAGFLVVKSSAKVVPRDPRNLRVPHNGWITIAFVPKGTAVPPPPNWQAKVARANGTATNFQMPGASTTVPGASPTTAPAAAPPSTPSSAPPTTAPGPPTTLK
ncbi:MAG: hypothetical protein JO265_13220 [Acidimicrobiia bacterium]|nr:hypothetical protein [Acidimicrobiia bacterium]